MFHLLCCNFLLKNSEEGLQGCQIGEGIFFSPLPVYHSPPHHSINSKCGTTSIPSPPTYDRKIQLSPALSSSPLLLCSTPPSLFLYSFILLTSSISSSWWSPGIPQPKILHSWQISSCGGWPLCVCMRVKILSILYVCVCNLCLCIGVFASKYVPICAYIPTKVCLYMCLGIHTRTLTCVLFLIINSVISVHLHLLRVPVTS